MKRIQLSDGFDLSQIALGFWRLAKWKLSTNVLLNFVEEAINLGVTSFDHADIYGSYRCEALFGEIIKNKPALRHNMQIITKCGIKLKSKKFPELQVNHYNTSHKHIVEQVEQSLENFHTDYIDLLLIHRPDPLMNPEATAKAFDDLKKSGKVLHFGVSNFTQGQFEMLQKYSNSKLLTNQVEISPYCLEHFENGNMDFFLKEKIHPMSWSPLARGKLLQPGDEKSTKIYNKLKEIAQRKGITQIEVLLFSWLLKHPAGIIPIAGTGKIEHLRTAVKSGEVELSIEEWFDIYIAGMGNDVP